MCRHPVVLRQNRKTSYTTFEYSNFQCSVQEFGAETDLVFTVDVTNTGKVAGKEVVMLYSRDMVASMVPENRRLRAFEKVEIQPGDFRMQAGDKTLMITCR